MRHKKLLAALLCLWLLAGWCASGAGSTAESYDTFDYRSYANLYPDLKAAYGYDSEKLYAHYVNFGRAEGRVGEFIAGPNPKTDPPLYFPKVRPQSASVLDPLPPEDAGELEKWPGQLTACAAMSNPRLVAEVLSLQGWLEGADDPAEAVSLRREELSQELEGRIQAVLTVLTPESERAADKKRAQAYQEALESPPYQRAQASNVTILLQYATRYQGLSAPPADPGAPGFPPVQMAGGFSDVPQKAYYAQPVVWAVERGIASGMGNGAFSPNQTCTQGQILTFLWRAKGSPEPEGTAALPGVKTTAYYYKAALWAAEQGLIGTGFSPESPCSRADAVSYLWKLADRPPAAAAGFSDVPRDAEYAQAVAWAVEQAITSGTPAGAFDPDSPCTRGQIVTFLYRAFAE